MRLAGTKQANALSSGTRLLRDSDYALFGLFGLCCAVLRSVCIYRSVCCGAAGDRDDCEHCIYCGIAGCLLSQLANNLAAGC
jgi:hypothetical protein